MMDEGISIETAPVAEVGKVAIYIEVLTEEILN